MAGLRVAPENARGLSNDSSRTFFRRAFQEALRNLFAHFELDEKKVSENGPVLDFIDERTHMPQIHMNEL